MLTQLTQSRLKEVLAYNPETGIFTRLVQTGSRAVIGHVAGWTCNGYTKIAVDGKSYSAHRLAWLDTYGEFPADKLDHIDQNKSNNRVSNLRPATQKQNAENTYIPSNNTSGFKGVSWDKLTSKWRAQICHHSKRIHIGLFATPEEASAAYEAMRDKLFTHHRKEAA